MTVDTVAGTPGGVNEEGFRLVHQNLAGGRVEPTRCSCKR